MAYYCFVLEKYQQKNIGESKFFDTFATVIEKNSASADCKGFNLKAFQPSLKCLFSFQRKFIIRVKGVLSHPPEDLFTSPLHIYFQ